MPSPREIIENKPWLGWGVAGILGVVAVVVLMRSFGGGDPYSVDTLTQDVTIKCTETGETWTMPRGRMEKELRLRAGLIDAGQGLANPSTGRPTGFPFDDKGWRSTVERLNAEKKAAAASRGVSLEEPASDD